jgi:hypothetical protein
MARLALCLGCVHGHRGVQIAKMGLGKHSGWRNHHWRSLTPAREGGSHRQPLFGLEASVKPSLPELIQSAPFRPAPFGLDPWFCTTDKYR